VIFGDGKLQGAVNGMKPDGMSMLCICILVCTWIYRCVWIRTFEYMYKYHYHHYHHDGKLQGAVNGMKPDSTSMYMFI
jgi:hypothetical protein